MYTDVFTTGQVAEILRVSKQTVIRCADEGTLRCFRVPGSKHRRIRVDDVRSFMTQNNIPVEWLDDFLKSTGRSNDST